MRLIDADAVKYEPLPRGERNYRTYNLDDAYDDGYDDAMFDINHMPTVDAVPVIRCKDCKWYYRGGATCMFWDGANGMCGDDFCGKAERKEE